MLLLVQFELGPVRLSRDHSVRKEKLKLSTCLTKYHAINTYPVPE